MNKAAAISYANTLLADLSKRHDIAHWRLDGTGQTWLQLPSDRLLHLELSPDNAALAASLAIARFDSHATGPGSVDFQHWIDELNAALTLTGEISVRSRPEGLIAECRVAIDGLEANALNGMLDILVTVSEDVGRAVSAPAAAR